MFYQVLNNKQREQLKWLKLFKREFVLVGGTAIALQIGHRKSVDFDLFKKKPINFYLIKNKLKKEIKKYQLLYEEDDGLYYLIDGVRWTFLHYPYEFDTYLINGEYFKMADLLTLAAMKSYALGRRSKWKDYVDLYVLLKEYFSIEDIVRRSEELYKDAFSEKLFRIQLSYFKDIDFSEPIEWVNKKISEKTIKQELTKMATS